MAIASVRQSTKPQKKVAAAYVPDGKYQAVAPEQQLYGIYGQQFANYLAQPSASAAEAAFHEGELRRRAANELEQYGIQLDKANAVQKELQSNDAYYSIYGQENSPDRLREDVEVGLGDQARGLHKNEYGLWELDDRTAGQELGVQVANADVLNNSQATRVEKYGSAVKSLADAGYGIDFADVGKMITPPTQETPVKVAPYMTPGDQTDRYEADEGLTFEEQMQLAQIRADAANANGDEIKVKVTQGEGGVRDITYEGSPEALIRNGINPETGKPVNPNAGANSGNAPATPTARSGIASNPASFFAKPNSQKGMRSDPITGKQRYHDGTDHAYPKGTPIPAESNGTVVFSGQKQGFGNYVEIKYADGSVVGYGHNSANSVKVGDPVKRGQMIGRVGSTGRSTGNHVHRRVVSEGNPAAVYAARFKKHPNVANVQEAEGGRLLVTLKNGEQRVYQNGKRVG